MVLQHLRPRSHLARQDDRILVHWDLPLFRYPLSQPSFVLFQRLLENVDLSLGITGRCSTLSLSSKVLLRFRDEQSRGPVPHLGVVEGFGELFDFLVPVSDWTLETPGHGNRG